MDHETQNFSAGSSKPGWSRARRRLIFLPLFFFFLLLGLAVAEGVLRHLDLNVQTGDEIRKDRIFFAKIASGPLMMDEYITLGARVYPLAPGNYRIPKEPRPRREDETLILCLGDSCTWGVGVEAEESYCNLLAGKLAESYPGQNFRTINAGRPGYTSFQGRLLMENAGIYLKPSIVLFHFGPNDGSDAPIRSDKEWEAVPPWALRRHRWLYLNSRLYQVYRNINMDFLRWRVRHPMSEGLDTAYHPRVNQEDFAANRQAVRELVESLGGSLIVIPSVGWNFGRVFKNPYYLDYQLQEADIDAFGLFSKAQKDEQVFLDSVHPNKRGHELLAQALSEKIADLVDHE